MKKGDRVRATGTIEMRRVTDVDALHLLEGGRAVAAPHMLKHLKRPGAHLSGLMRWSKVFLRHSHEKPIDGIYLGTTTRWTGYVVPGYDDEPPSFSGQDSHEFCMVAPLQMRYTTYVHRREPRTASFVRDTGDRYYKPIMVLRDDLEP